MFSVKKVTFDILYCNNYNYSIRRHTFILSVKDCEKRTVYISGVLPEFTRVWRL
ncbi:hypothetical protein CLOHYLEM_06776 [[Clostridium] hylemonae DSM 15053]|uniref:Uncharacterized protein n=1 Tax=[Clostridium] hylemonae DSM 15053 TaxID=553973 RepID=C0C3W4_9FIRM|nr:hypothetical protein CLOHYLEM_06776 [[Clostridium] hylemonae DSM 15053]